MKKIIYHHLHNSEIIPILIGDKGENQLKFKLLKLQVKDKRENSNLNSNLDITCFSDYLEKIFF